MSEVWFYVDSERAVGPLTLLELMGRLRKPHWTDTLVWRVGVVNSFLSGCIPSYRAKTANSGVTDAQIDSYCNCIASYLGSALTYRQLGKSNVEDYVRQATVAAASSCQVRR